MSLLMLYAKQEPSELLELSYCLASEYSAQGLIWVGVSPVYALYLCKSTGQSERITKFSGN